MTTDTGRDINTMIPKVGWTPECEQALEQLRDTLNDASNLMATVAREISPDNCSTVVACTGHSHYCPGAVCEYVFKQMKLASDAMTEAWHALKNAYEEGQGGTMVMGDDPVSQLRMLLDALMRNQTVPILSDAV